MPRTYGFRSNYSKDDIDELISLYRKTNHQTDLYFMVVMGIAYAAILISFFHDKLVSTPFALPPFLYLVGILTLVITFLYISVRSMQLIKKSDEYLEILVNLMGQEKRFTLSDESRKSRKIILPVVIIILVNLLFLQLLIPYLSIPSIKYNATISYPQNNAEVEHKIVTQGTFKDIPENKDVWVYVYGLQEKKYYPVKAIINKNNSWEAPVQFGDINKDKSTEFEIGVIVVEKSDQSLANFLKENSNEGVYGFPLSVEKITSHIVKRK